jgi:hypothetical protein
MRTLGMLVVASALLSTAAGAENAFEDTSAPSGSMPTEHGTIWSAPDAAVLWNNGPLITHVGTCPGGTNESQIRPGGNVFGYAASPTVLGTRLADNFTVGVAQLWEIQAITFFGYQTGGGATNPTITQTNYQIWNGRPGDAGAVVICGSPTANQLAISLFSGIYRTTATAPCPGATTRAIWSEVCTLASNCAPCLPQGTYWVDFQHTGTLASGPFVPPVTPRLGGPDATPDARQLASGVWADVVDNVDGLPEEIPFVIEGVLCGATPVEGSTWGKIKGQYR